MKSGTTEYKVLHLSMRKLSPKPEVCQFCFNKPPYDLACIGEYNTDLMNWKWSCRSCHQKYDYTNGTRVPIRLFGKDNPFFDKKHTVEAREKMRGPRPSISGDKNPNFGKRPMFGKTHSEETRHKISLSQIGKHPSEETRRKLRLTCTPMRRLRIKLARESRRYAEKMFMTGTFHIPEQEWMSGCLRHSIDIK